MRLFIERIFPREAQGNNVKRKHIPGSARITAAHDAAPASPAVRIPHLKAFVILAGACLIANLPFLRQAFHIDDSVFIYLARHILSHPLDPYNFSLIYNGVSTTVYSIYSSPPLGGYLLAAMLRLFGEGELPLHAAHLFYPMMCGIFVYLIARKCVRDDLLSLGAALVFLLSPALSVMGHTIMLDVPSLFFFLATIYLFMEAGDRGNIWLYVASGFFGGAACLMRYTALAVFPILFLFFLARPANRNVRAVISPAVSGVIFLLWYFIALKLYSSAYWSNLSSFQSGRNNVSRISMHFLANITYCAGTSVFPLSFFALFAALRTKWTLALVGIAVLILLWCGRLLAAGLGHTPSQITLFLVICVAYSVFLAAASGKIRQWISEKTECVVLFVWIIFLMGFNSLFLHASVKYNVLTMPPIAILFVVLLKDVYPKRYVLILAATIILTAFLASMVSFSDMRYANSYKEYAEKVYKGYKREGNKIFFTGHWGWEYYMAKMGAQPIVSNGENKLSKGDIIVIPSVPWPQRLPPEIKPRLALREKVDVPFPFPIRTMSGPANAFFYANYNYPRHQGVLPYTFAPSVPLETFYVLEVQ